jgi:hypothetical protein
MDAPDDDTTSDDLQPMSTHELSTPEMRRAISVAKERAQAGAGRPGLDVDDLRKLADAIRRLDPRSRG